MTRALIVVVAATLFSHHLEAQIEIRTRSTPAIGAILAVTPVAITTPALKFTGYRFTPKTLATTKLVFTGWRWIPVTYKANSLVFTGWRWMPVARKTNPIVFTGMRKK